MDDEKENFRLGELFKNKYGVFRLNKNSYSSPGKEYIVSWQPTEQVTVQLVGVIQVTPKSGTDILTISIETTSSQKSTDIVNQLMTEYGEMTKEDKNAEAALTLVFVDNSLKSVQHEIDSIQKDKTDFQKANNLIDLENQTANYLTNISDANKSLKDQEILVNVAGLIENYLKDKQNDYRTVPSSLGLPDLTLSAKIDEYNKDQLYRASLLQSHIPPNNPLIKEQDETIEKLRTDILEALKNIKSSTTLSVNNYRQRENVAQDQVKALATANKKTK